MVEYNIEEVKELWQQEPDDNRVFRAATEDIKEYAPEVQEVIKEEAERRRKANEAEKQKFTTRRISAVEGITASIVSLLSFIIIAALLSLLFGHKIWGAAGIMWVAALIKIWKPKKVIKDDRYVEG